MSMKSAIKLPTTVGPFFSHFIEMASAPVERAGVVQDELTGEMYIPGSQRPDGTWRKARRVKDGYIPQEEMPTYENRGVQWLKSKSNLPPGLNPEDAPTVNTTETKEPMSKSAKKNAKRKEKKKQQQEGSSDAVQQVTKTLAESSINSSQSGSSKGVTNQSQSADNDKQNVLKKLRTLRKKLKQIEDLEERIKSGQLKEPEKEQLEKISKKKAVVDEIEDLELELDDD